MKLMVIGGGGREHAIIKKLKENPAVEEIYCLPGNGGIAADAVCVPEIGAKDIPAQVEFAKAHGIDYAVVAPDDPLALGAVDALTEAGIPCFGPDKKAAVIEASKAFSKDLMKKYGIPTAKYELFTDADAACAYIEAQGAPIVVKADGLALGKGVVVAQTVEEAKAAVRSMIEDKSNLHHLMQKSVQARKNRIISAMSGQFQSELPIFKTNRNTNRNLEGNNMNRFGVKLILSIVSFLAVNIWLIGKGVAKGAADFFISATVEETILFIILQLLVVLIYFIYPLTVKKYKIIYCTGDEFMSILQDKR